MNTQVPGVAVGSKLVLNGIERKEVVVFSSVMKKNGRVVFRAAPEGVNPEVSGYSFFDSSWLAKNPDAWSLAS